MPCKVRRGFGWTAWLGSCALVIACGAPREIEGNASMQASRTFEGWGFTLRVPSTAVVRRESPVEDFELYKFALMPGDSAVTLSAFAGNHPRFPSAQRPGGQERVVALGALRGREIAWADGAERRSREVLIELPTSGSRPQFVHFWYRSIEGAAAKAADAVVTSIQPTK
jgi:hypothetical protein